MKSIREVMIAWTPGAFADFKPETAGTVALVPWPDAARLSYHYTHTDGACFLTVREELTDSEIARYTLATALALIVREGLDPAAVHKAFSGLIEYRDSTPRDMPR